MTNLSDLFPAGAGKQVSFTASGNVTSSGKPVVLNSDGTVSEVSGTSTVIGSATDVLQTVMNIPLVSEITGTNKTYAGLSDYNGGSNKGTGFILTASSNAITVGAGADYVSVEPYYPFNCYDSVNSRIVHCWKEKGATRYLKICLGSVSGTTITWGSRNEVQTSLTIGSDYYVQTDGTISTTSTSPAQLIGKAITATQINIKDYTG